jgi:metal transporter CNNM
MTILTWAGIVVCLTQSAMLSGLNLALFSVSRLELAVGAKHGDPLARKAQKLRERANFALVTILWANVGVNVLLALLAGSVLGGVAAFLFSTVVITIFAEIVPQAYFTRHALRVVGRLAPLLRFYQAVLFPVAWPTAWLLDRWLGPEAIRYFRESDLREVIRLHMEAGDNEIARAEGQGAMNFLDLDDVPLHDEGEALAPESVIRLEFVDDLPVFPELEASPEDGFLRLVARSGQSSVVLADPGGAPRLVLQADDFLRGALFGRGAIEPLRYCHRPIVMRDPDTRLGSIIPRFRLFSDEDCEDLLENDVILLWGERPRIITGTDILGRLLRGIAKRSTRPATARPAV